MWARVRSDSASGMKGDAGVSVEGNGEHASEWALSGWARRSGAALSCAVCVLLITRRAPVQLWFYFVMPVAFWAEVVHRRKVLGAAAATARASGECRCVDGSAVGEGVVDLAEGAMDSVIEEGPIFARQESGKGIERDGAEESVRDGDRENKSEWLKSARERIVSGGCG